jgi:hypothetical protein
MSPQTETKAGSGFKAGVKDYRLTYYSFEGMAEFICVVVEGVHWYFPESSLLSLIVLSDHDTATLDYFTRISCSTQRTPKASLMIHLCPCRVEEPP